MTRIHGTLGRIRLEPPSKRISYLARKQRGEIIDKVKDKIKQAAGGLAGAARRVGKPQATFQ
jgi:hypothetical protein